jgi:hypothetical protein
MDKALQQYKCHKTVRAAKIIQVDQKPNPDPTGLSVASSYGAMLTLNSEAVPAIEVAAEWMIKHKPEVGGYYVVYEDGYASYSPQKAFEDGYSLIEETETD